MRELFWWALTVLWAMAAVLIATALGFAVLGAIDLVDRAPTHMVIIEQTTPVKHKAVK